MNKQKKNFLNDEMYFWKAMTFIWVITCAILVCFIIFHNQPTKEIQNKACFYNFDLNYECNKKNGTIIPVIENNIKYWTCSAMNYTIEAC